MMKILGYGRLVEVLTSMYEIPCQTCGIPIEKDDVMQVDVEENRVMYYCNYCRFNGVDTFVMKSVEEYIGCTFDLLPSDFDIDPIITKRGVVINRKLSEEQETKKIKDDEFKKEILSTKNISYTEFVTIIVKHDKVKCYKCDNVIKIEQINAYDIQEKRIEYECVSCGNKGFRYISTINPSLLQVHLKYKDCDFGNRIKLKSGDKIVNESKGKVRCEICLQEFWKPSCRQILQFNVCEKCYKDAVNECPDCKKDKLKRDFIKIENLKKSVCNSCYLDKYKICTVCGNPFKNELFTNGLCIFCHPEKHFGHLDTRKMINKSEK